MSINIKHRLGTRTRARFAEALFVATTFAALTAPGCYEDEALTPRASLQVFYLDSAGVEQPFDLTYADSVDFRSTLVFRSDAEADDVVIWTGDRVVDFGDAELLFRDDSYAQMLDFGVPVNVVDGLRALSGQRFTRERDLSRAIRRDRLFDIQLYLDNQDAIREAIYVPVTGNAADGSDSIAFVVNHAYEDYLTAQERGYYGVSGVVMRLLPEGAGYRYEYNRYPRPGTFTVTAVATGVGDFGRETRQDLVATDIRLFKLRP